MHPVHARAAAMPPLLFFLALGTFLSLRCVGAVVSECADDA